MISIIYLVMGAAFMFMAVGMVYVVASGVLYVKRMIDSIG